jgi:hypothetical protein
VGKLPGATHATNKEGVRPCRRHNARAVVCGTPTCSAIGRSASVAASLGADVIRVDPVGGAADTTRWPRQYPQCFRPARREFARQRQTIIAPNSELQERELIKLASLASAMAEALRRRGVGDPAASLAAEAGIAVFRIAFEHWINGTNQRDLPQLIRGSLQQLKTMSAGR